MTMPLPTDDPAELHAAMRRWLRQHKGTDETLKLRPDQVAMLAEELGRLGQSNDRLRKQNKKLRGRIPPAPTEPEEPSA